MRVQLADRINNIRSDRYVKRLRKMVNFDLNRQMEISRDCGLFIDFFICLAG